MHDADTKLKIGFVLFLILYGGCKSESENTGWKSIHAQLKTLYTIGDADSSYYFDHPDYAVTSGKNKVIIADRGLNKLMVFDEHGHYLHDIGSRGPGPTQFRDIMALWSNGPNEITVFDRSSQTFKLFTTSGEYIRSYVNRGSTISTAIAVENINSNSLLVYRSPMNRKAGAHLLHVYKAGYDSILSNGFSAKKLDGYNDMMINLLGMGPGSVLVMGTTILFTPRFYNGDLYMYNIAKKGSSLTFIKKIQGLVYVDPITEINKHADYYDIKLSEINGIHKFYVHNQTLGLFQLNDGRIVHFTYIENKEGTARTFGVEIYTSEMKPLGYAKLYTKKFENVVKSRLLGKKIMAKDSRDRFYVRDITGDYDKYEVVKLEMDSMSQKHQE